MKKIQSISFLLILGIFLIAGCGKDFLDEAPTGQISPEQLSKAAKNDPSILQGDLAGVYATMYKDGSGGTDLDHDDFGQKGYDIFGDMISGDMVLAGLTYGWYGPIARLQATVDNTRTEDYIPWRYYYKIIHGANAVIDALGGDTATLDASTAPIMGQAKALRGYGYFYLTQFYSIEYGDGSQKILPIYKTTNDPANHPKSSAKEVFDLIVSDLNDAVHLLDGFHRDTKNQINKYVAEGLLSYALSYRNQPGDLKTVDSLTSDIMSNFPVTDSLEAVARLDNGGHVENPQSGFNDVNTESWMWGMHLTTDQSLDLVSWWGQIDMFTYSYAAVGDPKTIDSILYSKIPANDIRKDQFVFGVHVYQSALSGGMDTSMYIGQPMNKFYPQDGYGVLGGQREITHADYLYMRSDEFYLLNAEANARRGDEGDAKSVLKAYLKNRIPDVSYIDNLSGNNLINEIYLQERIEFWGEGKSYLALKRLKKTVHRGNNHLVLKGQSFPYDDPKLTFKIPQKEEQDNPVLND